MHRGHAPQQEKPLQRAVQALQLESSPCPPQREKSVCSDQDPAQPQTKINWIKNQEWTRLSVCGDSRMLISVIPSISTWLNMQHIIWRIQGGFWNKYRLLLRFWTFLCWRLALSSIPRYFPQMPSEKHLIIIAVLLVHFFLNVLQ